LCVEKQRRALTRGDPNGKRLKEFLPQHVDHRDVESFNEKDLERLIQHASKDLDDIDRKREQEFKDYELKKEYQRRTKLAVSSSEKRRHCIRLLC
jgi:nucleobindin